MPMMKDVTSLPGSSVFRRPVMTPASTSSHHPVGQHLRVHAQVLVAAERSQHRVGDLPDARPGASAPSGTSRATWRPISAPPRPAPRGVSSGSGVSTGSTGGEAADVARGVTGGARHARVHLGDQQPGALHRARGPRPRTPPGSRTRARPAGSPAPAPRPCGRGGCGSSSGISERNTGMKSARPVLHRRARCRADEEGGVPESAGGELGKRSYGRRGRGASQ